MPAFIQISDPHIVAKGELVCGHSDTATALRLAIATINTRLPALGEVEHAIVTGDLTDHGTDEEYAHFAEIMADLALPWMAIPGNHDGREAMRRAFAALPWMPPSGPIQWKHDFGPFVAIGLDSLLEGAHHGWIAYEGFDFLDQCLTDAAGKEVIVATHHPCMTSGIPAMDADNLHNGADLIARLTAYAGPAQMVSGHVHRAMTGRVGRVPCQIGPATGHAVLRDTREGSLHGLTLEPGGVMIHAWSGDADRGLYSDVIPVGDYPGPWPFT